MPKLPVLSGRDVIRGLCRLDFQEVSQSGSHVKLRRGAATVIVPNHREVRRGTLANILKQSGVTVDELLSGLAN